MNTHDIEPLKYGGNKSDDYVTGWNDCFAAIEAVRKRRDNDQQPFGYFRPEPFGWTDCAATDDGAIALYERPQARAQGEPVAEVIRGTYTHIKWKNGYKAEVGDKFYLAPQPAEPVAWPTHEFAIVIDRFYEGEGPSLAIWNGESYQFSDGDHDLYRGEDDSLGGYTAEWLTHRELERRLFCSQQIVKTSTGFSTSVTQEPVAFLCRECDEEGWSTYAVMPHEVPSTSEFLHVEPLYASPVAEPVRKTDWNNELSSWSEEDFIHIFHERPDLANRLRKMLAEPVKYKRLSGWTHSGIESLCISLDIQQEQSGGGSKACAVAASLLRGIAEQHFSEAREPL